MKTYGWGVRIDKWRDQRGPLHLMLGNGAPACGVRYYTTSGPMTRDDMGGEARCLRCARNEARQMRVGVPS